jgi:hypothetical protein
VIPVEGFLEYYSFCFVVIIVLELAITWMIEFFTNKIQIQIQ